jgi:hypothetical protein
VEAGLELLVNYYFPHYAQEVLASEAFCCAGRCCEILGRIDEALGFYERASFARPSCQALPRTLPTHWRRWPSYWVATIW